MKSQGFSVKTNGIFGFIFLILMMLALFFVVKGIFKILTIAAPVLIIGALIINYRTVVNYFRFVLSLFKRSVLTGIIAVILSIIGFPLVAGILFGKSILDRKVNKLRKDIETRRQGEFVEFEEVVPRRKEQPLDLPPIEKARPTQKGNQYEDLF